MDARGHRMDAKALLENHRTYESAGSDSSQTQLEPEPEPQAENHGQACSGMPFSAQWRSPPVWHRDVHWQVRGPVGRAP